MSAPMKTHARIRLSFDNVSVEPSWMFVEHKHSKFIKDIKERVCNEYFEKILPLSLTLSGCCLPHWESSRLLHDDDIVHVRVVNIDNATEIGYRRKEFSEELISIGKKKKKKKDKERHDRQVDTECSEEEKEVKKKKRKHEDADVAESGLNAGKLRHVREKLHKTSPINLVETDESKKINACTSKDNTKSICDVHVDVKESKGPGSKQELNVSEKKKRKRKRKRKNQNASGDISSLDLSLAKEQSIRFAESLLQGNNIDYLRNQDNGRLQLKQRGCNVVTPINKYKKFESDDEGDQEMDVSVSASTADSDINQLKPEPSASIVMNQNDDRKEKSPSPFPYSDVYRPMDFSLKEKLNTSENTRHFKNRDISYSENVHINQTDNSYENFSFDQNDSVDYGPSQCTSSTSANGVTVYSRPRNRRERRMFQYRELSKEEQLNTKFTNKSYIFKNEVETQQTESENAVEEIKDERAVVDVNGGDNSVFEAVPLFKDYTKFPHLQGTPRNGTVIAYKVIEMSDMYTPEVSDFKEAVVCNFDTNSQTVELEVRQSNQGKKSLGKFDIMLEDEDSIVTSQQTLDKVCLPWSSLMEIRLVTE